MDCLLLIQPTPRSESSHPKGGSARSDSRPIDSIEVIVRLAPQHPRTNLEDVGLLRKLKRVQPSQINRDSVRSVRNFRMRRMAPASEGKFRLLRLCNDFHGFGYILGGGGTDDTVRSLPGGLVEV
jgi:hypothetical protein